MTLDDHEIQDNWEPGASVPGRDGKLTTDPKETRRFFTETTNAYRRFQRMAGPPLTNGLSLWTTFVHAGVPFFLADTRTERFVPPLVEPRRVDNWHRARIMGPEQWTALQDFLVEHRDTVSFVASPAMLLPRTLGLDREPSLALSCDGWDGFPASMHALLALLCEYEMDRVVFLSGGAHVSMIVRGTVEREHKKATFWSVHSSGLYSPYPFANGAIEDYATAETFSFATQVPGGGGLGKYQCTVDQFRFEPGDGFATITLRNAGNHDELLVCFDRTDGPKVCDTIELPLAPGAATASSRPSAAPVRR
jgi:phosphodiesterase/alkaline phosphatase D-like protein